jgi:hypothetical protein
VTTLTLLGGVCLFLYGVMIVALGAMGHAGTYADPATLLRLHTLALPPLALSPLCIISAVGILTRARLCWYLSNLVWILAIAYLAYAAFTWVPLPVPTGQAVIVAVILVNLVFLAYFQFEEVKRYFKMQ